MPRRHTYQVSIAWTGNQGSGTSSYRDYGRDHQVAAEGRPPIEASSEPLFRGDPARWNPELSDEPHRHDGNDALHYDLAWGDFASGDYLMLHLAQAEPARQTTGAHIGITVEDVDAVHQRAPQVGVTVLQSPCYGQWGRCATYEDPDRNTISVTTAGPAPTAGEVTRTA